jgi:hypothetical protein
MQRIIFIILATALTIISCGRKKSSKNDIPTDPGSSALLKKFTEVKLPFVFKDSLLDKETPAKEALDWKDFTAEIPDTIFYSEFGKGVQPKLFAVGTNYNDDDAEHYLFVKAVQGDKRVGYIICFNGMEKFKDAMPFVYTDLDYRTNFQGVLSKDYAIDQVKEEYTDKNEALSYRISYLYNNGSGKFQVLLTTDNDENIDEPISSPIDTLPKKNKFSADYGDANNLISIRDGASPNDYIIFVHMPNGELKGPARLIGKDTVRYIKAGDMCQLNIVCRTNEVSLSEASPCRNHTKSTAEFKGIFDKVGRKKVSGENAVEELKKLLKPSTVVRQLPKGANADSLIKKLKMIKPRAVKRADSSATLPPPPVDNDADKITPPPVPVEEKKTDTTKK